MQAFEAVAKLRGTRRASRRSGTSGRSSITRAASRCAARTPTCPGRLYRAHGLRARVRLLHRQAAARTSRRSGRASTSSATPSSTTSRRATSRPRRWPGQLGPGKGKDFDNGNAMGPCLVTADEIGDPIGWTWSCASTARSGAAATRATCTGNSRTASRTPRAPRRCIRRVLRLRHGRQRLRPRADAVPQARRHRRARGRRHRHPAQPGGEAGDARLNQPRRGHRPLPDRIGNRPRRQGHGLRAVDPIIDRTVAIKTINLDLARQELETRRASSRRSRPPGA